MEIPFLVFFMHKIQKQSASAVYIDINKKWRKKDAKHNGYELR